jgi:acetylornithine deacetylase/succinyl-diaminopimelate desuccinylase-like protein
MVRRFVMSARVHIHATGHYDVQPAQESYWDTDPWTLSGRNG